MARLRWEMLERVEAFCDRVVDVCGVLEEQGRSRRILEQLTASGTSVGANAFEADEAVTKKDFVKCLAITIKELNETRFWIRFVGRRECNSSKRLGPLEIECVELKKIFGTMIARSRAPAKRSLI